MSIDTTKIVMPTDEQIFEVLSEAFTGLDEGHFRIMKETQHPYWFKAEELALLKIYRPEKNAS